MAPVFSKEAILQGNIDHLCLVCESYLKTERDVCLHISTTEHKQNLDDTDYVDEYKNDRIRKVKKWYYCEFCNVLVSTTIHVRLHVAESRHNENKKSQMTARVDDFIIFGDSTITEESWHGFIDDNTCIICNVEFENMENHKKESSHIINLIQSTVCNHLNHPYREIDDSTFHCLMCNAVVSEITVHLKEHKHINIVQNRGNINPLTLEAGCNKENDIKKCSSQSTNDIDNIGDNNDSKANASDTSEDTKVCDNITVEGKVEEKKIEEHNIIRDSDSQALCIVRDCTIDSAEMKNHLDGLHHENMLEVQEDFTQKSNSDAVKNNKNMSDIIESIKEFNNESININFESRTAVCSKCSVNLEFDYEVINNHIKDHKNDILVKKNATTPLLNNGEYKATQSDADNQTKQNGGDVIQQMVEQHDLTYAGTKLYCKKCNKDIPKSVRNINEHVKGVLHRSKASLTGTSTNFQSNENKKLKEKKYNLEKIPMCKFVTTMAFAKNTREVIIDDKYCIHFLALICVTARKSHGQLRCHICEVNVNRQNLKNHLDTPTHDRAINEVPVITNMETEFIREIRSETFQCGFCNIFDSWEGMENHLKSTPHRDRKNFANWRLVQLLTDLRQIQREQIHHDFLMNMIFSRTWDIENLHDY